MAIEGLRNFSARIDREPKMRATRRATLAPHDGQAEAGRVHLEGQGAVLYDAGTCETLVMDFQGTVQVRGARPSPVFLFHRQVLASAAPAKRR